MKTVFAVATDDGDGGVEIVEKFDTPEEADAFLKGIIRGSGRLRYWQIAYIEGEGTF